MKTTGLSSPNATFSSTHVQDVHPSQGEAGGPETETIFSSLPPGPSADAFLSAFRSSPDLKGFMAAREEGARTLQQQFGRDFGPDLAKALFSDRPLRQTIGDAPSLGSFEDPTTKL